MATDFPLELPLIGWFSQISHAFPRPGPWEVARLPWHHRRLFPWRFPAGLQVWKVVRKTMEQHVFGGVPRFHLGFSKPCTHWISPQVFRFIWFVYVVCAVLLAHVLSTSGVGILAFGVQYGLNLAEWCKQSKQMDMGRWVDGYVENRCKHLLGPADVWDAIFGMLKPALGGISFGFLPKS